MDDFIPRKQAMGARYQQLLQGLPIQVPVARTDYADNHYWVFGVVLDDSVPFDADGAMKKLGALGIGTRPFFWPMHEQPVLQRMGLFEGESHPVAERIARRGFYLPSGMALTEAQQLEVAAAMREILQ
jgi:perosamine synthetase